MKSKRFLTVAVLTAFAALSIVGCSSDVPNSTIVTQGVAYNPVTIHGKIIDKMTRKGIAGATVKIKVNGYWITATTAGDTSTAPDSAAGDFSIGDLPANTVLTAYIKGPAVTTTQTVAYLAGAFNWYTNDYSGESDGINQRINQDIGQFTMAPGVTATVRVIDRQGLPVTLSSGGAIPIGVLDWWGSNISVLDTLATRVTNTGAPDTYTIVVAQDDATILTVPALDTNGDNKYDYTGGAITIQNTDTGIVTGTGNLTTNIVLAKINNTTALSVLATSAKTYGSNAGGIALTMIGRSEPYAMVFNMPLTAASVDALTMTYTDDFKNLAVAAVTAEQAITAALSNSNTVLTITPAAALIEGKTYTFMGTVQSTATGAADTVYVLGALSTSSIMVKPTTTATTLSAAGAITVDNYNYWSANVSGVADVITAPTGSNPALANDTPYMIFPEPVWGTARLISTTTSTLAAGTVINNNAPVAITGQSMAWSVVANSAELSTAFNITGGKRAGLVFLWDMTVAGGMFAGGTTVPDSTTAVPRIYKIGLDIYDADGNKLVTEADYAVQ